MLLIILKSFVYHWGFFCVLIHTSNGDKQILYLCWVSVLKRKQTNRRARKSKRPPPEATLLLLFSFLPTFILLSLSVFPHIPFWRVNGIKNIFCLRHSVYESKYMNLVYTVYKRQNKEELQIMYSVTPCSTGEFSSCGTGSRDKSLMKLLPGFLLA